MVEAWFAVVAPKGVPPAERDMFKDWSDAIMALDLAFAIAFWSGPSVRITG